jgi:hypothetical protein
LKKIPEDGKTLAGRWLHFEANPGKQFTRPYLKKSFTKKWLVEWLKV